MKQLQSKFKKQEAKMTGVVKELDVIKMSHGDLSSILDLSKVTTANQSVALRAA